MKAYNLEQALRQKDTITELCIHRHLFQTFPEELFSFPKLRKLELSSNGLRELPKQLSQLTTLESLIITDNQLLDFPSFLAELPRLRLLDLSKNAIQHWPTLDQEFPQLEQLLLAHNQLQQLPNSFQHFSRLKILDLSYNQIGRISGSIGQLLQLRQLSLQHNIITRLSARLSNCQQLSELQLQHNRLRRLPDEFGPFPQLYRLALSNNRLSQLPDINAPFLNQLELSYNRLRQMPQSLSQSQQLRVFNLNHNQLTQLPSASNWPQLRSWKLNHNQLQQWPVGIDHLRWLEELSIKKNPISGFHPDLLHLSQLRKLEGLLRAKDRRLLLRFLKICRKRNLPIAERQALYALLQQKKGAYTITLLIKAGSLGIKSLKENAIQQLMEHYDRSIEQYPLSQQSKVGLLGKSKTKFSVLSANFQERGIPFNRAIDEQTTHVVMGQQWSEKDKLPASGIVLIREEQLFDLLYTKNTGYLQQASDQQLHRLRSLLCSRKDHQIEIALQILKGGGLPPALLTEVFIAWKTAEGRRLRNELRQLLNWNTDGNTRGILSASRSLSSKLSPTQLAENIHFYTHQTQLDENVLQRFFGLQK